MVNSMTGFGRSRFESEPFACTVEVKSVNHRFLDPHLKLPTELSSLEINIRRLVQSKVKRGRVDLAVNIERNDAVSLCFNTSLLRTYLNAFDQLKRDFGISGELDMVQLLRIPGIMNLESLSLSAEDARRVEEGITRAVITALDHLNEMKLKEGEALRADILKRLEMIHREVTRIRNQAQNAVTAQQIRLQNRLQEMLQGFQIDPNRLLQEAAFCAERSDISEELTRLESHCEQCRTLLDSAEDVGKMLDFLLQEMNREVNTILSKTTGLTGNGLEIANSGISIKTEVEKIREQIQNVE